MPGLRQLLSIAAFAAFVAGGTSCSTTSTSIEQSWRAPNVRPGVLHTVVTIVPSSNESVRRGAEDKLARKLVAMGVYAVPGYSVLRPSDLLDRDSVARAVSGAGFDGVVAMRFVDAEQTLDFDSFYDPFWGAAWEAPIPDTIVRIEIDAYSVQRGGLVWTGLSKSVNVGDVSDLIDEVTDVVAHELVKQRLLSKSLSASR